MAKKINELEEKIDLLEAKINKIDEDLNVSFKIVEEEIKENINKHYSFLVCDTLGCIIKDLMILKNSFPIPQLDSGDKNDI